jgi:iron complex transport system permease protein
MQLSAVDTMLTLWDSLSGSSISPLAEYQQLVITDIRWPRTLLAMFVGAILAICGAVTQGLFRNPLADPGIIGVSSGAGLGAAIAIVILPVTLATIITPVAAFAGGLVTTLLVYRLAQSQLGSTSVLILLLAGVAVAAFSGAVVGFLTFIANDQALRDLTLWGMGSLNGATVPMLWLTALTSLSLLLFYQRQAVALNALLLGEAEAEHLGIDTEKLKRRLIIVTAAGVGVAVSASGIIGFVSLVIPHLVRMTLGPDHRQLLPLSALTGAALLLMADIGARVWMAPAELPVGLVTALLGAPFFVFLLLQQRQRLSTL